MPSEHPFTQSTGPITWELLVELELDVEPFVWLAFMAGVTGPSGLTGGPISVGIFFPTVTPSWDQCSVVESLPALFEASK